MPGIPEMDFRSMVSAAALLAGEEAASVGLLAWAGADDAGGLALELEPLEHAVAASTTPAATAAAAIQFFIMMLP
jgi:hypothetical protein